MWSARLGILYSVAMAADPKCARRMTFSHWQPTTRNRRPSAAAVDPNWRGRVMLATVSCAARFAVVRATGVMTSSGKDADCGSAPAAHVNPSETAIIDANRTQVLMV